MSFVREYAVKAVRKPHRCGACRKTIEIGKPATRWAGMTDGDFGSMIFHPDCRAAEIAYNRLADMNWGEWLSLADHDREDDAWLLAEWPSVAERMGIRALGNSGQVA